MIEMVGKGWTASCPTVSRAVTTVLDHISFLDSKISPYLHTRRAPDSVMGIVVVGGYCVELIPVKAASAASFERIGTSSEEEDSGKTRAWQFCKQVSSNTNVEY